MKTLIIGCGYVGLPLALAEKARGNDVTAWVHSQESAEALKPHSFSAVIVGSVADESLWLGLGSYDHVVHCASSGRGGPEAYREVFVQGARNLNAHQPAAKRLLVSSTSVYGQSAGEIVTEISPADPTTETGRILREAEDTALAGGAIVARSAGIYGPGRAVLFQKLTRGEAVMEGDGSRWMNQIHRDDVVSAIEFLSEEGEAGQIYNVCDDAPTTQADYYQWCSSFLGVPMPPSGPLNMHRKRGSSNKQVSNARLRSIGWRPKFPSFREGIASGWIDHSPR